MKSHSLTLLLCLGGTALLAASVPLLVDGAHDEPLRPSFRVHPSKVVPSHAGTAVASGEVTPNSVSSKLAVATGKRPQPSATEPKADPRPSAEQQRAQAQVRELTTTQKSKMLTLLNEGSADELAVIRGISETRAAAIAEARPFDSIDEVILVRGIGESTFEEVITHARSLTQRRRSSTSTKK